MAEINGTDGNDVRTGGEFADTMRGLGGNDTLSGLGGNDILYGDGRVPLVVATTFAAKGMGLEPYGNDLIHGNAGNDTIYGGDGNDRLFGDTEADTLYGGYGTDVLDGGDGDDFLYDALGGNTLNGGRGNDDLTGSGTLNGDAGTDVLYASSFAVLRGGEGEDQLWCGTGAQRVDYNTLAEAPARVSVVLGQSFEWEAIHGFKGSEGDRIDVSSIDANALVAGNQAFRFVGTQAVDQAGEIGFATNYQGERFLVAQVTNGAYDDLAIRIADASGAITAAHLIL